MNEHMRAEFLSSGVRTRVPMVYVKFTQVSIADSVEGERAMAAITFGLACFYSLRTRR